MIFQLQFRKNYFNSNRIFVSLCTSFHLGECYGTKYKTKQNQNINSLKINEVMHTSSFFPFGVYFRLFCFLEFLTLHPRQARSTFNMNDPWLHTHTKITCNAVTRSMRRANIKETPLRCEHKRATAQVMPIGKAKKTSGKRANFNLQVCRDDIETNAIFTTSTRKNISHIIFCSSA